MGAMDVMLAFPTLVFALALVAFLGASARNVIIAIAVIAVPVFARLVRAQTLTYSEREFVVASRASGATDGARCSPRSRRTSCPRSSPSPSSSPPWRSSSRAASASSASACHYRRRRGAASSPPVSASSTPRRTSASSPAVLIFLTVLALNTVGERLRAHFDGQDSGETLIAFPGHAGRCWPLAPWCSLARNGAGCTVTLLRTENLTTYFRTRRGIVRAVDDVSFDVEAGTTLAIVGESGSGKSVLTRSLLGLHTTTNIDRADGRVFLDGVDLRTLPRRELRRIWGQRIGLVSQNPMVALNPVVRVGRQITEVLRKNLGLSVTAARARAVELLEAVGIPDPQRRMREYPHQLCGGLRQRVTIAIAISCEPDLLIADEPTTALDVTVQAQILALLRSLQQDRGMAMIFVSHDLGVVAGLADEIAVMYAGRIVERLRPSSCSSVRACPTPRRCSRRSPRSASPAPASR